MACRACLSVWIMSRELVRRASSHGRIGTQALTASLPVEAELADEMVLSFEPRKMHFFDRDGRRFDPAVPGVDLAVAESLLDGGVLHR